MIIALLPFFQIICALVWLYFLHVSLKKGYMKAFLFINFIVQLGVLFLLFYLMQTFSNVFEGKASVLIVVAVLFFLPLFFWFFSSGIATFITVSVVIASLYFKLSILEFLLPFSIISSLLYMTYHSFFVDYSKKFLFAFFRRRLRMYSIIFIVISCILLMVSLFISFDYLSGLWRTGDPVGYGFLGMLIWQIFITFVLVLPYYAIISLLYSPKKERYFLNMMNESTVQKMREYIQQSLRNGKSLSEILKDKYFTGVPKKILKKEIRDCAIFSYKSAGKLNT